MVPLITENLEQIRALCREYHVKTLYVFGSAAGEGIDGNAFGPESDVDLLVEFEDFIYDFELHNPADYYFGLYYALKELLHREVDLVSSRARHSEQFKKYVEQQKQFIYAA